MVRGPPLGPWHAWMIPASIQRRSVFVDGPSPNLDATFLSLINSFITVLQLNILTYLYDTPASVDGLVWALMGLQESRRCNPTVRARPVMFNQPIGQLDRTRVQPFRPVSVQNSESVEPEGGYGIGRGGADRRVRRPPGDCQPWEGQHLGSFQVVGAGRRGSTMAVSYRAGTPSINTCIFTFK
jgi:hypothetical protein